MGTDLVGAKLNRNLDLHIQHLTNQSSNEIKMFPEFLAPALKKLAAGAKPHKHSDLNI